MARQLGLDVPIAEGGPDDANANFADALPVLAKGAKVSMAGTLRTASPVSVAPAPHSTKRSMPAAG